ncbi:DgyrCDS10704 [Dimorphilus gyrociliatus]|uniref:DgyrCDS10704 n=1 Tax=Dimorphilus gyrociliatus TaxID=2664684 RepID=A0A7I8W276_9ANNE|nr:DgyrCDS10704 [Dimorphilus gyrociliatus]
MDKSQIVHLRENNTIQEFKNTGKFEINDEIKKVYDDEGVFCVRNLFSKEEIDHILKGITETDLITSRAWDLADGEGRASRLVIWSHPGNDVTGMVARSRRLVESSERLLGGEVYHYHSKLMMKEPHTGGKHLWHQDYGYWYKNGMLRPDVLTVFIALDVCNKTNGGLQVVPGTHKAGRIEHDLLHGQTVANYDRVNALCEHYGGVVYADLQPGDALFFHSNVLHTSDKNDSDLRRWCLLLSYNRADNDPIYKHHHPNYTQLKMVEDSEILSCQNFTDMSGKEFMDPAGDKTVNISLKKSGFH